MIVEQLTYIDPHTDVAAAQIFHDAGLVEESEVGHVAGLEKLRGVHLVNVILLQGYRLMGENDRCEI